MSHHEMEKALTTQLPGSGYKEANLLTCVLSRDANKSHSGQNKAFVTLVKTAGESCHSVFSLKFLDLKSATIFSHPAMWSADSQISLSFAKSHRSRATKLQAKECVRPPLLTYDTTFMLSSISFI